MKFDALIYAQNVLAFDRKANCMRLVHGADCILIDDKGDQVFCDEFDTHEGWVKTKDQIGRTKKRFGSFQLVLKTTAAEAKARE